MISYVIYAQTSRKGCGLWLNTDQLAERKTQQMPQKTPLLFLGILMETQWFHRQPQFDNNMTPLCH